MVLFRKTGKDVRVRTLIYYCLSIFFYLQISDHISFGKVQYPLFTLLEYSFFAILVFQQLKLNWQKLILIVFSVSFFLFQIIYYFSPEKKRKLDSIPIGIETILIFIFIFFFLYEQLRDAKELPIYDNYFFWVAIGLFIYLGGSFFIYLMGNTLERQELIKYWFFTYIVETIKNLLLIVALFVYSKNPNKSNSKQVLPNLDFML